MSVETVFPSVVQAALKLAAITLPQHLASWGLAVWMGATTPNTLTDFSISLFPRLTFHKTAPPAPIFETGSHVAPNSQSSHGDLEPDLPAST